MSPEQRKLFDATIATGKTPSYAHRVAQGKHTLGGRTGPKPRTDLDVATIWIRWKVDKERLVDIAASLDVSPSTLRRRLQAYRESTLFCVSVWASRQPKRQAEELNERERGVD